MFADQRIQEFFTKRDQPFDFVDSIYTIHLTDQKLYNKFEYEIRAHVGIQAPAEPSDAKSEEAADNQSRNFQAQMVRNMLYLADFMSKLRLKYQVIKNTQERRLKIYE